MSRCGHSTARVQPLQRGGAGRRPLYARTGVVLTQQGPCKRGVITPAPQVSPGSWGRGTPPGAGEPTRPRPRPPSGVSRPRLRLPVHTPHLRPTRCPGLAGPRFPLTAGSSWPLGPRPRLCSPWPWAAPSQGQGRGQPPAKGWMRLGGPGSWALGSPVFPGAPDLSVFSAHWNTGCLLWKGG